MANPYALNPSDVLQAMQMLYQDQGAAPAPTPGFGPSGMQPMAVPGSPGDFSFMASPDLPPTGYPAPPGYGGIPGAPGDEFSQLLQQYLTNQSGFLAANPIPSINNQMPLPVADPTATPFPTPGSVGGSAAFPVDVGTLPPDTPVGYPGPMGYYEPGVYDYGAVPSGANIAEDQTPVLPAADVSTPGFDPNVPVLPATPAGEEAPGQTPFANMPIVNYASYPPPGGQWGAPGQLYGDTAAAPGGGAAPRDTNNLGLPMWTNYIPQIAAINALVGIPGSIAHFFSGTLGQGGQPSGAPGAPSQWGAPTNWGNVPNLLNSILGPLGSALGTIPGAISKVAGGILGPGGIFSPGGAFGGGMPKSAGGFGQPMGYFVPPSPPGIGEFGAPGTVPGVEGRTGTEVTGGITYDDITASGVQPRYDAQGNIITAQSVGAPSGGPNIMGQGSMGTLGGIMANLPINWNAPGMKEWLEPIIKFNMAQGPALAKQVQGSFPGYAYYPSPSPGALDTQGVGGGYHPPSLPGTHPQ